MSDRLIPYVERVDYLLEEAAKQMNVTLPVSSEIPATRKRRIEVLDHLSHQKPSTRDAIVEMIQDTPPGLNASENRLLGTVIVE